MLAGLVAWALPAPPVAPPMWRLALGAVAEEAAFRWGLQETLSARWPAMRRLAGPVSLANVAASATFSLLHLFAHQPAWALATFVPSLAFGYLWDRHRQLFSCVTLHLAYNVLYFFRP